MAKVIESGEFLILKLSRWEKIGSLHSDLKIEKTNLIKKFEVENPWKKGLLKGVRAPGTAFPYVILLGTMRYRGGKDFAAIYKKKPVTVYELKSNKYKRWIVSN